MITVDTREPDVLIEHLENEGADEVQLETMSTGDFLVRDYIVERKQYGDFIGRMTQSERDIWQQMLAMEAAADKNDLKPVLLLEGDWESAMQWTNMTPKGPTKAIASIFKMGISIVHTMGPRATAQWLIELEDDTEHNVGSIRDSPSLPDEMRPQYIVEGAPGVGPSRAQDLLKKFGTPVDVFSASVEELTEVSGIGDATAQKIIDAGQSTLPD